MEAATNSGVAIPLDMVEDKNGHMYTFVKTNGPKYIFQIIQGNIKSVHLIRCSLSLIIITITLLRRKCLENIVKQKPQSRHSYSHSATNQSAISAWASDSLAKIIDTGTVSVCIDILVKSSNPTVQELALNLLAMLLPLSPTAIEQMLQPPSSAKEGNHQLNEKFIESDNDNKKMNVPSKSADPLKTKPVQSESNKSRARSPKKPSDKSPESASCLSHVLSVALLQKNRHLLLAGCADVILAMLTVNQVDLCEVIASTPTCHLPALEEQIISTASQKNPRREYSLQQQPPTAPTMNPLASRIIEWAGLKILLKFLFRYEKITHHSRSDSLMRDSVSAALRLKEEYQYTHQRVFTAVCSLIAGSPAVATFANTLSGAEELLRVSALVHRSVHSNLDHLFETCMLALKLDKRAQQMQRSNSESAAAKSRKSSAVFAASSFSTAGSGLSPGNRSTGVDTFGRSNFTPALSGTIKEKRSQKIQLMPQISVSFQGDYDVNLDKSRLYAEKNDSLRSRGLDKENPIRYAPNSDVQISKSLSSIDKHTMRPIAATPVLLQPYKDPRDHALLESLDEDSSSNNSVGLQQFSSTTHEDHHFRPSSLSPQQKPDTTSPGKSVPYERKEDGNPQKPSAYKNFFGQLPAVPVLPERIEPAAVIDQHEDMRQIREKFAALAAEAIRNISNKGKMRIIMAPSLSF